MSPVSTQVSAATTTTARVRPVFCTTLSMVIGPRSTPGCVWVTGPPGVPVAEPVDQVAGLP